MKLWITILLLYQFTTFSQDADRLSFDFFDPNIKLYVIGESHFEDDDDLQIALLNYVTSNTKVDAFVFELSSEVGLIFNDYVTHGNRKSDVDTICSLLHKKVAKKVKMTLEFLKSYNLKNDNKIKVVGIDHFHFHKLERQMRGLNTIFPEAKNIDLPVVQKYVVQQEVKDKNRKKSALVVREMINEVEQNWLSYQQQMGERVDTYVSYIKNLEFLYLNSFWYKKCDSIRESNLSTNLVNTLDSTNVCFMICGSNHALMKMNDDWPNDYPFSPMTAVANQKYPNQVFSIIMQHHDKKIKRYTRYYNLLDKPISDYVEDNSVKYVVIDQRETPKHEYAKERASMIIIQNKFFKYKKRKTAS